MKVKLYALFAACFMQFVPTIAQDLNKSTTLPHNASESWFANASAHIRELEYQFRPAGRQLYHASNASQRTNFIITPTGYKAQAMTAADNYQAWWVEFSLLSAGRPGLSNSFGTESRFELDQSRLVQYNSTATIEYLNSEKGLRQNFIIDHRPAGTGRLEIRIGISTSLESNVLNRKALVCSDPANKETRFIYEDLKVWDANQQALDAYMEMDGEVLSLVVDDNNAVYPVTVDPLNKIPEWTSSANGLLPSLLNNLNLQVNALYGYSVIGLGDINADGYDDVAISAPAMADVISGTGTLLSVGAVFVYKGDASGLHAVPDQVLQPSTQAGALFGFSMAAGNITADGLNDLVVGAPLDRFATNASTLLGPVSTTVTAGKVYVFRSETMFASQNPSPLIDIHLSGTGFFSHGVINLLASNVNVKALFGFSVAVTEDLNADSRQDIIVGSPGYLGTGLLDIQSGAAFVYYSSNLSTTTPVQLNTPTPSVLGLSLPLANLNGLLFGFSVEGVGNYNNDNYPDVVVGAPAGVDLSTLGGIFSGQVLGGSAYVYYGTGAGVNPAIGAKLQASSGALLGSAANLFGYKIKALRNAAGARNGNLLISAPTGGVLSNLLAGLKLKAGQVHLFKKQTSSFTSPVASDQALSSPRASSILSLLTGQSLDVSLLYGASMDNLTDVNCDGLADIIVGEPLSTNVPLIGANITGGAAYVYLGKADGSFQATPSWTLATQVSSLLGVNATSLVGFSVAGAGHTNASGHIHAIVGGPANSLDFGSGLLNLGNTLGTLSNFVFDNNGIGKSYSFDLGLCGLVTLPTTLLHFNGRKEETTVALNWITAAEPQVNNYELQRSGDGVNFTTIAMVFARGGTKNEYQYADKFPLTGVNYYRLRIVDNDSKFNYSQTVIVRFADLSIASMAVAPNPVKDDINIRFSGFEKGNYTLKLFSTEGRPIQVKKINLTTTQQTDVMRRGRNIPAGIYWLSVFDENDIRIGTVRLLMNEQ